MSEHGKLIYEAASINTT